MGDPRHDLGRSSEDTVAAWLERAGWRVLERRRRSVTGGEVDLVALDPDGVLVAIEVRARRTARAGSALESIDGRRVDRLRRTLVEVARVRRERSSGLRVDLVAVEPSGAGDRLWRLRRVPGVG
jgi:putative endonuclease